VNSKRVIAQLLQHLSDAGITHVPRVELPPPAKPATKTRSALHGVTASAVVNKSAVGQPRKPGARAQVSAAVSEPRRPVKSLRSMAELKVTESDHPATNPEVQELLLNDLSDVQQKQDALCSLAAIVAKCRRCQELATTRKQTVFGTGDPNARIMFIGEAPGAEEDARGEPFVGEAGQLLNKIVTACTLKREDIYICNVLRCRPPGNRNPLPQEAANCREFLNAQIRIVQPEYIICWGAVAAQNLLNETRAVGKLRRQFFTHNGAKVMCTYHPSYLLRNPSAKKEVWEDMKFFMRDLGVELQ
jgi:uracil-DNA glycosylase family 4